MPLWHVYHPPSTFTNAASKAALCADLTAIYTSRGLPAFYVVIIFHPTDPQDVYVGGVVTTTPPSSPTQNPTPTHSPLETHSQPPIFGHGMDVDSSKQPFIRLEGTHIAITIPSDEKTRFADFTRRLDNALYPHIGAKGYAWEYHVLQSERQLWKIDGVRPPPWGSEEEGWWREKGRVVEWEGGRD